MSIYTTKYPIIPTSRAYPECVLEYLILYLVVVEVGRRDSSPDLKCEH